MRPLDSLGMETGFCLPVSSLPRSSVRSVSACRLVSVYPMRLAVLRLLKPYQVVSPLNGDMRRLDDHLNE